MEHIINIIKEISSNPLRVYAEDGVILELSVKLHSPLDMKERLRYGRTLPDDYIKILEFSNGMEFYYAGDYSLYSLKMVAETQQTFEYESNIYPIGYFLGDTVLLVLDDTSQGYSIYAGDVSIANEFILLGYDFSTFMNELLLHNCSPFWSQPNFSKYYEF